MWSFNFEFQNRAEGQKNSMLSCIFAYLMEVTKEKKFAVELLV